MLIYSNFLLCNKILSVNISVHQVNFFTVVIKSVFLYVLFKIVLLHHLTVAICFLFFIMFNLIFFLPEMNEKKAIWKMLLILNGTLLIVQITSAVAL